MAFAFSRDLSMPTVHNTCGGVGDPLPSAAGAIPAVPPASAILRSLLVCSHASDRGRVAERFAISRVAGPRWESTFKSNFALLTLVLIHRAASQQVLSCTP